MASVGKRVAIRRRRLDPFDFRLFVTEDELRLLRHFRDAEANAIFHRRGSSPDLEDGADRGSTGSRRGKERANEIKMSDGEESLTSLLSSSSLSSISTASPQLIQSESISISDGIDSYVNDADDSGFVSDVTNVDEEPIGGDDKRRREMASSSSFLKDPAPSTSTPKFSRSRKRPTSDSKTAPFAFGTSRPAMKSRTTSQLATFKSASPLTSLVSSSLLQKPQRVCRLESKRDSLCPSSPRKESRTTNPTIPPDGSRDVTFDSHDQSLHRITFESAIKPSGNLTFRLPTQSTQFLFSSIDQSASSTCDQSAFHKCTPSSKLLLSIEASLFFCFLLFFAVQTAFLLMSYLWL